MSWRAVVISNSSKLEYQLGYLIIRNEKKHKIHLSEIHTIIIESTQVVITTTLISELIKKKIKIIFCDEKHNPQSELVSYYASHDTSGKLKKQLSWTDYDKEKAWQIVLNYKITAQKNFLTDLNKITEAEKLDSYINSDMENKEAISAKVYFSGVFGNVFTRYIRSPINDCLNYGYTLLLSAFNREITSQGYITQVGIFHRNNINHFNLSSDLMEPFRIIVDRLVYAVQPQENLNKEYKNKLQELFNYQVMISGRKQYLNNAINMYTHSVFDSLNNGREILMYNEI